MAVEISQGICDLCGLASDASLQECNWLTCTYQHCEGGLYHQECLEKYLKSNKLEKNRKTGFKCPRGCGKGTRFDQACPGRIDKSHPIHPRNEDKKKTKLAAVVVEPQRPAKPSAPTPPNGKAAKPKEESKADAGKDSKSAAPAKAVLAAKPAAAAAAASPLGQKAVRKDAAALPPRPEVVAKQKLAELAAQARREIGLPAANSSMPTHGSKGDLQVLASSAAGPSKPAAAAAASAWGKPSTPAVEAPAISPQPTMISQLPQFQQLLQQAAGKKQAGKTTLAGSASVATQAAPKPTPAVPQPVTPPTPMWPALATAQASAAALSSSSSTPTPQTPREATPRPGSPPSAWGTSAAAAASTSQQQPAAPQPSQQAPTPAPLTSAASASRPDAGSSASGPSPCSSSCAVAAAAAAGPSTSASVAAGPFSAPATAAAAAAVVSTAGAATAAGTSCAQGPATTTTTTTTTGSSGAASSSGRTSASELQSSSTAMVAATSSEPAAAGPADPSVAASSRSGLQLVGADFTDDETAKEPKLTKAQRKNLKRTEKKKSPLCGSGDQQQGSGEGAGQETSEAPSRGSLDGGGGGGSGSRCSAGGTTGGGTRQSDAAVASGSGRGDGGGGGGGSSACAHRRHLSRGSDDPEQAHTTADEEEAAVMEELCINCIVARKVLSLITQLQRLGALEFVAAAAVQRHGSNLLAALEWLLVAGAEAASGPPEAVLAAAAESVFAAESEVDISEELQHLHDLRAAMGVPTELLQQCVLDCNGDVQSAANTAMERLLAAPSGSSPAAAAAAPTAGGGAVARVSSGSMLAGGQANGVVLRGSPSFYSVSSLEGVAVSGPASDAAHAQSKQARSSHFGVRLQDEPAGCSGGGSTGYAMGDAIAAGFLRGGVVMGASGWPNGYLRETPPPPGFDAGPGAGAGPSSGGGRSTSRLMHWLREEPGRAAVLAEAQASASGSGGMFVSDPVLDSPFSAHGRSGVAGAGNAPSLSQWVDSNGRHHMHHHHHHPDGTSGPAGQAGGGLAGAQYAYCGGGDVSNGNFSFVSALSKPPSLGESLGGYGSRWASLGPSEGSRQDASGGLLFGGATEAEPAPHSEGGSDLSSIMALISGPSRS